MAASRILEEIKQSKPFPNVEQELGVAFMLTADRIRRQSAPVFEAHGLTSQQYNVLRILRGAGKEGLPTLAVADRLVEHTPGITRLIDRLEAKSLVSRQRPDCDRRQVYCSISKTGLELLDLLAPEVDRAAKQSFNSLAKAEMQTLLTLFEKIRNPR